MLQNEIGNVSGNTLLQCTDPDEAYNTFLHILKGVYEKCIKFKTAKMRELS